MGISNIVGAALGSGVTGPLDAISRIINSVYTTEGQTMDKERLMAEIMQRPDIVQMEINKIEAQHRSVFVAGWRPFVGWVCGFALAYHYILRDVIMWLMTAFAVVFPAPPQFDLSDLIYVLGGLLGMGSLRTFEKIKGRAK